ncbi:MAG: hypothetical protein M0P95_12120 [Sulfuritalea sp.]|jgi:hypothetical protein|nr:hypothetical protein [Sulfuritalea sp.]
MTSPKRRLSLEEVLDEFFFSADEPSTDMVLRACKAYPEYRADILEFAALWASHDAAPEPENVTVPPMVSEESISRLQSFVLNRLHALDQKAGQTDDTEAAKKAVANLAGGELRRTAAAAQLGGSTLLLQKILTNSVKNVPSRVLGSIANHLNVTLVALQQILAGTMAVGRRYRASDKPNAPVKETWESAVHSLPVSDEEKSRLLALQGKEDSP